MDALDLENIRKYKIFNKNCEKWVVTNIVEKSKKQIIGVTLCYLYEFYVYF